jgi:hypothetical protein
MENLPHNIIDDESGRDDTGRKVIVNSVGGALHNAPGKVLWGPYKMWYMAQSKVKGKNEKYEKMVPKKFVTDPYWSVLLEGYDLEIYFCE